LNFIQQLEVASREFQLWQKTAVMLIEWSEHNDPRSSQTAESRSVAWRLFLRNFVTKFTSAQKSKGQDRGKGK